MDFAQLLEGLSGWPAAVVLSVLIFCVAWVVVKVFGDD